ncbi:MAG: hypothetical protein QOE44_2673, partial [Solirubrobacteraceae bacterium]|nr:hypothetical protein [Solirubrobacteraceae bacterium]
MRPRAHERPGSAGRRRGGRRRGGCASDPSTGAGAGAARSPEQGSRAPARAGASPELYREPGRLAREVNTLAAGGRLTFHEALPGAREDAGVRRSLVELAGVAAVALVWAALVCLPLEAVGVPIAWSRVLDVMILGGVALVVIGIPAGLAVGVAVGVSVGVVGGIAAGLAGAAPGGVVVGLACGIVGGVAVGVASWVDDAIAGLAPAWAIGGLVGAVAGLLAWILDGPGVGFAVCLATPAAAVVTARRLHLAPIDIAFAWWLDRSGHEGVPPQTVWAMHPARWNPSGDYGLPGLSRLLVRLEAQEPALAVEARRIVAANPARAHVIAEAAAVAGPGAGLPEPTQSLGLPGPEVSSVHLPEPEVRSLHLPGPEAAPGV